MKIKTVVSAILAMSLATGGVAFGQGNSDHNKRGRDDRGHNEQAKRQDQQDRRDDKARQKNRHENQMRMNNFEQRDVRGAGPNHQFHKGQRLPPEYHNRQYVVDDWRGYNLSAPPRGYHWVQTGGDYVLVAIATGVILQLLLNN